MRQCTQGPYLNGLSPGLRCLVTSSNCLPFLATNSASLIATFSTSGSVGARGPEGAGQEAHRRGQRAGSEADDQNILSRRKEQHDAAGTATCWFDSLPLILRHILLLLLILRRLKDCKSAGFSWLVETGSAFDSLHFLDSAKRKRQAFVRHADRYGSDGCLQD